MDRREEGNQCAGVGTESSNLPPLLEWPDHCQGTAGLVWAVQVAATACGQTGSAATDPSCRGQWVRTAWGTRIQAQSLLGTAAAPGLTATHWHMAHS